MYEREALDVEGGGEDGRLTLTEGDGRWKRMLRTKRDTKEEDRRRKGTNEDGGRR